MIHAYELLGHYIVLDIFSGAVLELDRAAYDLLHRISPPMTKEPGIPVSEEERETWDELFTLQTQGLLFSQELSVTPPDETPLKALCLHVCHDCNLRCGYCFAGTGDFGTGHRARMTPETAEQAVDYLLRRCGDRTNLEIDFFGGEPLMAMDTVRHTVEYARRKAPEKHFRFTITTNGLLLDDENITYINREMDNVVLSLDGRPEVNDAARKTVNGKGSYHIILPLYKKLVQSRTRDYFIRGTYTAKNLDFVKDLEHLAAEGFHNLSIEPVVLPEGHPLAIRQEHLSELFNQYELLCKKMIEGVSFSFFHFTVDLEQGPCIYKRLRGCGAGYEYAAVTPEGEVYPCHQFAGRAGYRLGCVYDDSFSYDLSGCFRELDVSTQEDCRDCWAKYYCSGGCVASNLTVNGSLKQSDAIGCALERKRLECAILLKIVGRSAGE